VRDGEKPKEKLVKELRYLFLGKELAAKGEKTRKVGGTL
jgi:hypothetical protein